MNYRASVRPEPFDRLGARLRQAQPERVGVDDDATMKKERPMSKPPGKAKEGAAAESPSKLIDEKIKSLDDWRGQTLAHVRKLI